MSVGPFVSAKLNVFLRSILENSRRVVGWLQGDYISPAKQFKLVPLARIITTKVFLLDHDTYVRNRRIRSTTPLLDHSIS